jgi:hypothetical protein
VSVEVRCTRDGGCICGTPLAACAFAEHVSRPAPDPLTTAARGAVTTLESVLRWYGDDYAMPNAMRAELQRLIYELKEAIGND